MIKIKESSRNTLIIFSIIALICLIVYVIYNNYQDKYYDRYRDINIHYKNGKRIYFGDFNKKFIVDKEITIENNSNNRYTYSLEWEKVNNQLKKQNDFIYTISGEGERSANLGISQVPVADAIIFPQALIEPHSKQTYTISFKYTGNEKKASFKGMLRIKAEKVKE